MATLLHKFLLLSGLLSLFHAAYSAAQRKQCGTIIKNKINISFEKPLFIKRDSVHNIMT